MSIILNSKTSTYKSFNKFKNKINEPCKYEDSESKIQFIKEKIVF